MEDLGLAPPPDSHADDVEANRRPAPLLPSQPQPGEAAKPTDLLRGDGVCQTAVPVTGGTGQRVVQPVLAAQVAAPLRMAAGDLTVDLTRVPLGAVPRTVRASVAVGQLTVEVPAGAVVDVEARTGIGTVDYGPAGPAAFAVPVTAFGPARPQLIVDAQVGIGRLHLVRGAS